jgi:hypothetical protein
MTDPLSPGTKPTVSTEQGKHTPGPWLLNADAKRHEPDFYGTPSEPGEEEVYTSIHVGDSLRLTGFMRPADARLIAAAPDLLRALKEVVALSDRKHDAWDAAHVAIAKAEGRS